MAIIKHSSEPKNETPESVATPQAGIQIFSEVRTDAKSGVTQTRETITRDGQTKLVRLTVMKGYEFIVRTQTFHYGGQAVAVFTQRTVPRSEAFTTVTYENPCRMSLEFSPSKEIEKLIIFSDEIGVTDGFTCSKGIFQPMTDAELHAGKARW
jgi:hypothetical protein